MKFRLFRPLLRLWRSKTYRKGSLGRSIGVGMVIGFSPTVGAQAVICLLSGLVWNRLSNYKLNLPAMLLGSIVVNPITMGPTYFLYYKLGCLIKTCNIEMSSAGFGSLGDITELSVSIFWPVVLGSIPFMALGYPFGVWLGNRAENFFEKRKAKKKRGKDSLGIPHKSKPAN